MKFAILLLSFLHGPEVYEASGSSTVKPEIYGKVKITASVHYYGAAWCVPCQQQKPIIDKLEKALPNVLFLRIDSDQRPDLIETNKIAGIPAVLIFRGEAQVPRPRERVPVPVTRKIGYISEEKLRRTIDDVISLE